MSRRWLIVWLTGMGLSLAAWAASLWCVGYRSTAGWRVGLCHGSATFKLSRRAAARSGFYAEGFDGLRTEWGFDFGSPYRKVQHLPLWAPLVLSLVGLGWWYYAQGPRRRELRRRQGRCQNCGYPLQGLDVPRCPECGTAFNPQTFAAVGGGRRW